MYKLEKIDQFEITRNLILKRLSDHTILTVFDDTDITGHDDFKFMQVGKNYKCKISIYAEPWEKHPAHSIEEKDYEILGKEKIAGYEWLKLYDEEHNTFYIDHILYKYQKNGFIKLAPLRYDMLEVNGIERTYDLEDV